MDTLVGQCEISTLEPFDELTLDLIRKKSSENSEKAGTIRILIENFENLEEIWYLCDTKIVYDWKYIFVILFWQSYSNQKLAEIQQCSVMTGNFLL